MNLVLEPEICLKIAELATAKSSCARCASTPSWAQTGSCPPATWAAAPACCASPKIYREMTYPWHQAQVAEAHQYGLKVLKHCCGHTWPVDRRPRRGL